MVNNQKLCPLMLQPPLLAKLPSGSVVQEADPLRVTGRMAHDEVVFPQDLEDFRPEGRRRRRDTTPPLGGLIYAAVIVLCRVQHPRQKLEPLSHVRVQRLVDDSRSLSDERAPGVQPRDHPPCIVFPNCWGCRSRAIVHGGGSRSGSGSGSGSGRATDRSPTPTLRRVPDPNPLRAPRMLLDVRDRVPPSRPPTGNGTAEASGQENRLRKGGALWGFRRGGGGWGLFGGGGRWRSSRDIHGGDIAERRVRKLAVRVVPVGR